MSLLGASLRIVPVSGDLHILWLAAPFPFSMPTMVCQVPPMLAWNLSCLFLHPISLTIERKSSLLLRAHMIEMNLLDHPEKSHLKIYNLNYICNEAFAM